jgi:hypothetical protein
MIIHPPLNMPPRTLSALDRASAHTNSLDADEPEQIYEQQIPLPRTPCCKVSFQDYRKVVSRLPGPDLLLLESQHPF